MKKNRKKDQEPRRKPRRLTLNRETILVLNAPALLGLARGGDAISGDTCGLNTCSYDPISEVKQNCFPTTCSGIVTTGSG